MSDYTYFLAYAGPDRERAEELGSLLMPEVKVLMAPRDLKPGDDWDRAIPRLQQQCQATVALFSNSFQQDEAPFFREEIQAAIAYHRQDPSQHRLIPVFFDGFPADRARIPYGIRTLNALDASKRGLEGVAAELKSLAGQVTATPPVAATPAPTPVGRSDLYDALCRLLPAQFEEALFRVEAPAHALSPAGAPLATRANELVTWANQAGPAGLDRLAAVIRKVAPGLLR